MGRDRTGFWGCCKNLAGRFDSSPDLQNIAGKGVLEQHEAEVNDMESINRQSLDAYKTVTVVGGIARLKPQYKRILMENHFVPRIYNEDGSGFREKMDQSDFIILFIGTVSHKAAHKVRKMAKLRAIPLATVTRSSITALRHLVFEMASKRYALR